MRPGPHQLATLLLLLFLALATPPANAADPRNLQAAPFGDRLDLSDAWLFHRGTGPDLQSATLDDSAWTVVNTRETLLSTGEFNLNEIWYRVHLKLAPGSRDLALTLTKIGGSYRVFVNGTDIGGRGNMSGRGEYLVAEASTFPIPDDLLAQGQIVIAIHAVVGTIDRVSFTLRDGISRDSSVFLGPTATLFRDQAHALENSADESGSILTLWAVLFLLAIALALLVRKVPAYPVLAVLAGSHLFSQLLTAYLTVHYLPQTHWINLPIQLFSATLGIATMEFLRIIADAPRRPWLTVMEVLYLVSVLAVYPAAHGLLSFTIYSVLHKLVKVFLFPAVLYFLFTGLRRHKQDAQILAGTAAGYLAYLAWWALVRYTHFASPFLSSLAGTFVSTFEPESMGNLALVLGFFLLLIVRTLRIVRERASIASEIEAARTMQQLLLGRGPQITPGFAVETVYLPAGEVGGDFFLLTPAPDGSLTAILGDVSGKGLLAAMRVSMILGVLRREPSSDPPVILAALNQALLTQGEMGFTTACCVRLEPSGHYIVANAGHISPYVMGQELPTSPALPLGLAPDQTYDRLVGALLPGQRLVLLSDGIPEARSPRGELYGFGRLGELTLQPAGQIASTAQTFGQDDDITVVTIACLPTSTAGVLPPPPLVPPPLFGAPPPPRIAPPPQPPPTG